MAESLEKKKQDPKTKPEVVSQMSSKTMSAAVSIFIYPTLHTNTTFKFIFFAGKARPGGRAIQISARGNQLQDGSILLLRAATTP
jgi:hypothetical protein